MNKALEVFFSPYGRISRGLWWASVFIYAVPVGFLLTASAQSGSVVVSVLPSLAAIPMVLVNGKRFHDRNKSAWWVLVGVVPLIGPLWIFVECDCLPGTPGSNRFGRPGLFGSESR